MINNEESFPRCFFSHKKENALFLYAGEKKISIPNPFFPSHGENSGKTGLEWDGLFFYACWLQFLCSDT